MTTVRFSATSTAAAATSISVSLGGTPSQGDLVLVFLSTDNEIICHQPNWNTNTQWHQLVSYRTPHGEGKTLRVFHHTWNGSDSGSSATFTFVANDAGINVGEKVIDNTNAMAVAIVLAGQASYLEATSLGPLQNQTTLVLPNRRLPADSLFYAGYSKITTLSAPDTLVQTAALGNQHLSVWSKTSPSASYQPVVTAAAATDLATAEISISDTTSNYVYVTPYLEEGPMADNKLMFRFKLLRHFTVLNNSGTFTAVRYQSTDQINAATEVYTNDQVITSTQRTNILTSGVGGEFRATA